MSDPWNGIARPSATDSIAAKRVNAELQWGFFWGVDIDGKCLFVLKHALASSPAGKLPNLRGIEISLLNRSADADRMLVFKLNDTPQKDIFEDLCRDIVASTSNAKSESEAVIVALNRTWRWHHLLRGGTDAKLSTEEQKGLICELLALERYFIPALPVKDAVASWRGPTGAPKDFECARICVEAKARRGAATPLVEIHSAAQLDDDGTDALFLFVAEIDQALSQDDGAFTVSDIAARIRDVIDKSDMSASQGFDDLLSATGFRWTDDYTDMKWMVGNCNFYRVAKGFPRITATQAPVGVSNVKYSISLPACAPFLAPPESLSDALKARKHVS